VRGARRKIPLCLAGGLLLLVLSGCGISTSRVVEGSAAPDRDPARLAEEAERLFGETPREPERVEEAFRRMSEAVRATEAGDSLRYAYAARGARFGVWLANHLEGGRSEVFADSALVLGNTALETKPDGVEALYWRALAAGLYARHHRLRAGRSAMDRIREDATAALRLDPTYEHGGPHRALGALYLRAPGPPAGVGSVQRAIHHLEQAVEIAPDHPDNLLLLAEAYLEANREEEGASLLRRILESEIPYGDAEEREEWRSEARALLERMGASFEPYSVPPDPGAPERPEHPFTAHQTSPAPAGAEGGEKLELPGPRGREG